MTRLLNVIGGLAGVAITGLTALPLDADTRAYAVFALGLIVAGVNLWMVPAPKA